MVWMVWSTSLQRAMSDLSMLTSPCTDPNILLRIKNLIMLNITTLKTYGTLLFDFLLEILNHYSEVLLQAWVVEFRDILENSVSQFYLPFDATFKHKRNTKVF